MECSGLKWNEVNVQEVEEDGNGNGIGKEKVSSAPPGHTSRKACHAFPYPRHTIVFPRVSACPWGPNVALSPKNLLLCVLYQTCRCDQGRTQGATKSEETYFSWFGFDIRRTCHVVSPYGTGPAHPLRDAKFQ